MNQSRLPRLRRISQIVFFLIFLFLLFNTEFRSSFRSAEANIRLPYPVGIFLELDPLIALINILSTHALYRNLLLSLIIIIPTLFLGRFFCGWICPMGTLNHFFSNIKFDEKTGAKILASQRYKKWQSLKYYFLIAGLVLALLGTGIIGVLDPISLIVRSFSLSVIPALNYGINASIDGLYYTNFPPLQILADGLQVILGATILSFRQPHFRQAVFVGLIFVTILVLNFRITRFWCRALCPLGALLGLLSRWSILGLEKHVAHCTDCNICLIHCQGGDEPIVGAKWRKSECHLCMNCVGSCPEDSLKFRFFPNLATTREAPDLRRRKVITSLLSGVIALPLMRSASTFQGERSELLIRPPGALDEDHFLERCIRCGECMKVCPNNALHPTFWEAGLEGIWTPILVMRIGYCEPSCVLCGQVCPTGAIWEITQEEKLGKPNGNGAPQKPVKIGTAFMDRGRCLPWAMATECIVCEEWCPTSPKSIYLETVEVIDAKGNRKTVRRPHIDPEQCTGCGACEYACPVQDRPAIYVTSIGESRSKTNQFILERRRVPK